MSEKDTQLPLPSHKESAKVTSASCLIVFGDLRGWGPRKALRFDTGNPDALPLATKAEIGMVFLATEQVLGQVVYDGIKDGNRIAVVYAGRRIPSWVDLPELVEFGWEPCADLPGGVNLAAMEVDALLLTFDDTGHATGWTRTIWLPYFPRPMQRLSIQLGFGSGPTVRVRVLEVEDRLVVDGDSTPFVVMSSDELSPASPPDKYGWARESWVAAKCGAWKGLDDLSHSVESHAETVLGHAMATRVTLHRSGALDDSVLPLLPRDVRTALDCALDASTSDSGENTA